MSEVRDLQMKNLRMALRIKDESELPPHITYNDYMSLLKEVENNEYHRYLNKKLIPYLKDMDKLLMEFMWALGGGISDIICLKTGDIDFNKKIITLTVKKMQGFINNILVSDSLLLDISNFMRKYNVNERCFNFTRQWAWEIVKAYGNKLGMNLHPHMFRQRLAIYLLQHGVSDKIIFRRLGDNNALTTIKYYMVIISEGEREALKGILL
jgi:integrase/recombinase XerD